MFTLNNAPMLGNIAGNNGFSLGMDTMGQVYAPSMHDNPLMFKPSAPSSQYNDFLSSPTINIQSLFLQETGTYNEQFHRPYVPMMNNDNVRMLQARVDQATAEDPGLQINGGLISGLCTGIIAPSANHEGTVGIVNGWAQKRFRFILVVEVPNAFTNDVYVFQGYSEFFDRSAITGLIDPRMIFFINSEIRLMRRVAQATNFGFEDKIAETRQFIDGRILSNNMNTELSMLRPRDVVCGIQSNHINAAVGAKVLHDGRTTASNDVVSNARKNGVPSNYLARTINQHRNAQTIADFGEGGQSLFDRTIQNLHEAAPNESPFIQRLSDIAGFSAYTKNTFTLNELERIDPGIGLKVHYSPVDQRAPLHQAGASSYLNGANIETMIANMISNGLAGIMIESGLSFVSIMTTTMNMTGIPDTTMISPGRAMTTQSPIHAYAKFIALFNSTLVPDLSRNNTIPFTATIVADLFGDIDIVITIDGMTPERCVFPAFADSLITPVATRNRANFDKMAAGVEDIITSCGFDTMQMATSAAMHFIESV